MSRMPAATVRKRDDVQLFVRLEASGVSFGLYLGRNAKVAGSCFRRNVAEHAGDLFTVACDKSSFVVA